MNNPLISVVIFLMLILFIFSPFAAFASLMLVLLGTTIVLFINKILQILISGNGDKRQQED
ncbi:hypothetical protein H6G76_14080 [Nostoc sp. FACHB-152]|uniref:hypothetical protein n=1 Tax=unclassified Nostoc TaxID=2593658 RepID=UPI0016890E6E|nr:MULTISPECIES: hypothetical protein [unclassified Nostoc]MBD2448275.1 hypothetical protein [Nostoc sp. FACHB-152]MBD2467437.1 hypothetical protein [Nostoc sp. FACHB-145]